VDSLAFWELQPCCNLAALTLQNLQKQIQFRVVQRAWHFPFVAKLIQIAYALEQRWRENAELKTLP
jgi:hypothetical protein